ncbi:MAG: PIN domain-containing protein [Candidatus Cloacimonetes bacterium]|nr:PIN domain-containing protein [Candidatus Cloacimonadota bacterium]
MKKLKLYLDTNVIGYLDEPASPKEMAETHDLWDRIKNEEFEIVLSSVTLGEIYATTNLEKRGILSAFIGEIHYSEVAVNDEIKRISELIKSAGILISNNETNDRLHIGCALFTGADVLISFNFKHVVNISTIREVKIIALREGYKMMDIISPIMFNIKGENK